jgi:alpha-beta hydrolase superfamily lysophospholipase
MTQQDTEQLRREIERTRAELGATVEALSHKTDVKAHARQKAELVRARTQEKPVVPLAVGIGAAVVGLWLLRRRRRS